MAIAHITDFIQSLSSQELKLVKRHISSENKINQLLSLLTKDSERKISDNELATELESSPPSIRVLKSRLFNKIREALLSDEHFENSIIFNERERIFFTLKKKVLFAKSLSRNLNHNRVDTYNTLLNEIIATGSKHQMFDILIEVLILQKLFIAMRTGISEFEKLNNQIAYYSNCFRAVQNANDTYYRLVLNQGFISSLTKTELKKLILDSIESMKVDYKQTNSHEVNYYMHTLKMALFESEKKFKSAIECCNKILIMIKKNITILYSKDRMGFAMGNLSIFNIYLGNYKKAISFSKTGQQFLIPYSLNHIALKEQEFFGNFYDNNFEKSIECCLDMLSRPLKDIGSFRMAKFIYYKACCHFKSKDFKEALKLIHKSLEIEKDKAGYNIMLRVLLIMIFIELNKRSEAVTTISTLRKHIERTSKVKEIKERDILILKLLIELEKDEFKRNDNNKNTTRLLKELSDKDQPTAWNYFTPELIPFHEWVATLPVKN